MTAMITLTSPLINSGNPVTLVCNQITVAGKRNITHKPNANVAGPVYIQTQSFDNLGISISGVHFTGTSGTLTYAQIMSMYTTAYANTAGTTITLNARYGLSNYLTGSDGATNIKVVLESFNYPIDATQTRDGYRPIGSLTFRETK